METTDLYDTVASLAKKYVDTFHRDVLIDARQKVVANLASVELQRTVNEQAVQLLKSRTHPADSAPSRAKQECIPTSLEQDDVSVPVSSSARANVEAVLDPAAALVNLRYLATSRRSIRGSDRRKNVPRVYLPQAVPVPKYDAWVPVNKSFWVGTEFILQPYVPWFGDDDNKRERAFEVYRRMLDHANEDSGVSDGELDHSGNFKEPPDDEEAWRFYDSLPEQRRRAACRYAISAVVAEHDRDNPAVIRAVADALNLNPPGRVLAMLRVIETRKAHTLVAERERRDYERASKRLREAWVMDIGYDEHNDDWNSDEAIAPLTHFCFTCHVFYCPQHDKQNVEPIVPIKDSFVDMRNNFLKNMKAANIAHGPSQMPRALKPCGASCHLIQLWRHQAGGGKRGREDTEDWTSNGKLSCEWTKEERILFREAVAIFKTDPCNVATVIGATKTCIQVAEYMQLPTVFTMASRIVRQTAQKRWPLELNRGGHCRLEHPDEDSGSSGGDEEPEYVANQGEVGTRSAKRRIAKKVRGRKTSGSGKSSGASAVTDNDEDSDNSQQADFVPCAHLGPCDKATCSCFVNGLACEATCGCNTGRWTARGYEKDARRKTGFCKRRNFGCNCGPHSHCNTSACPCWEQMRSCDPDFCNSCEASILPSQITANDRRCRNVGVPIGRHKRTIVGKSLVHGFGLFAGEVFEEGDLVGIYGGQIMDTNKADMVGFLYDAKDHTFFFDVTRSLVVDGGVLGMKSKFVNHTFSGSKGENCMSRCVRVRGMAHIALFATRRVETGEEFLFDYKFVPGVVPVWAKPSEQQGDASASNHREEDNHMDHTHEAVAGDRNGDEVQGIGMRSFVVNAPDSGKVP